MAIMSRLRHAVRAMFSKHLFITNTLSCGGLLGLGDAIQQVIEQRKYDVHSAKDLFKEKPFDWHRTGRMTIVGCMSGPLFHVWYKFLDGTYPARTVKVIAKKIILDESICSPAAIFVFLTGMGLMEGQSMQNALKDFRTKFWQIYIMDWLVWPPVQAFNFYVLPPHYRVIYVNVCTLVWDVFLSYVKHKDQVVEEPSKCSPVETVHEMPVITSSLQPSSSSLPASSPPVITTSTSSSSPATTSSSVVVAKYLNDV